MIRRRFFAHLLGPLAAPLAPLAPQSPSPGTTPPLTKYYIAYPFPYSCQIPPIIVYATSKPDALTRAAMAVVRDPVEYWRDGNADRAACTRTRK